VGALRWIFYTVRPPSSALYKPCGRLTGNYIKGKTERDVIPREASQRGETSWNVNAKSSGASIVDSSNLFAKIIPVHVPEKLLAFVYAAFSSDAIIVITIHRKNDFAESKILLDIDQKIILFIKIILLKS